MSGAARTDGMPSGQQVSDRFKLLLERFPRGDGEPWRAVEIEEATGGEVTSSYVSALRKGKFKRPGIRQLELIADVMGFPFELWRTAPELWEEELRKHPPRGSFRGPAPVAPSGTRTPPHGQTLGVLLDDLFENKPNPATGEPFTEEEVATRSRGRLTAAELRRMRRGELEEPPPEVKLLTLSDVFDVPPEFWYAGEGGLPQVDLESLQEMYRRGALIRHRQQDLSPAERNMLEMLFAALDSSRKEGESPGG